MFPFPDLGELMVCEYHIRQNQELDLHILFLQYNFQS
nr:MAG TPA: hypothetical protein [Caudoviricetes sp.]